MRAHYATVRGSDADFALIEPSAVQLSQFTRIRREPTRPVEFRGDDFARSFDDDTLFFDCFHVDEDRIALVGPSFFNLKPALEDMMVTALPAGHKCAFSIDELERHGRVMVTAPVGTEALELTLAGHSIRVAVHPSGIDIFAGKRVLLTLSKNNHLHWVRDWIAYYVAVHGADAVLIYDNDSTNYTQEDLLETISGINGVTAACVVKWPFKFGPQGDNHGRFWDSDFCQHGALENARWRFLQKAASVSNCDIDELVVSRRQRSLFACVEQNPFGVISYRGRWIMGTDLTPVAIDRQQRLHRDYDTVLRQKWTFRYGILPRDRESCPPKWTVVPAKCPPSAQWGVHSIYGWLPSRIPSRDFSYRHFREISDGWKYQRRDRQKFDPAIHEEDHLLRAHYKIAGW